MGTGQATPPMLDHTRASGLDAVRCDSHRTHTVSAPALERSSSHGRWRMHDLVRLYATPLEDERADQDGREEAMERLLEDCLAITRAAIAYLDLPGRPGRRVPEREQALR